MELDFSGNDMPPFTWHHFTGTYSNGTPLLLLLLLHQAANIPSQLWYPTHRLKILRAVKSLESVKLVRGVGRPGGQRGAYIWKRNEDEEDDHDEEEEERRREKRERTTQRERDSERRMKDLSGWLTKELLGTTQTHTLVHIKHGLALKQKISWRRVRERGKPVALPAAPPNTPQWINNTP